MTKKAVISTKLVVLYFQFQIKQIKSHLAFILSEMCNIILDYYSTAIFLRVNVMLSWLI